ncbi:MAG TPA: hypothetical protein VM032_01975 [Vicinamibacterales bacterium]|nr:hypothetical protein [Vicinamibacterales bacterium]
MSERAYVRIHRGSRVVIVIQNQDDALSVAYGLANALLERRRIPLEHAQSLADAESGCPHGCACPAWFSPTT